jgi:uncharacterized protein (DUF58 family)
MSAPASLGPRHSATETAPEGTIWAPTRALGRAILVCGVLIMLAVILGRLDLVVLAAPFAVGVAVGLRRRPTREPEVAVELTQDEAEEGGGFSIALQTSNRDTVPYDLAVSRLTFSSWLDIRRGDRPYVTELGGGLTSQVDLRATAQRWGHQDIGPAIGYAVACDGLMLSTMVMTSGVVVRVHPAVPPFRADETMPRSSALVGVHRSRRSGEGGELAGVRRFGPGDRLRRVDWRVTLRTRELHVAHTLSDRDAEVVVLLDVLHEAGESGGVNGSASVVDTSVRAAAAITEHYLRQGDRVALLEFSGFPRHLRMAGGRRHLRAALEWLLYTRTTEGAGDPPVFGIDPYLIPSSALVVVLTPLLGNQSAEMIATIARAGRSVVAVDTLGPLANRPVIGSQWTAVAQRLWRLERENLIGQLREVGVPVTAWAGAGSLDQVLHDMVRMAAAPRIGVR